MSVLHDVDISIRTTPESSTKSRTNAECDRDRQPYQVSKPPKPLTVSLATRVSHVFSTPNFRVNVSGDRERAFRRSHSATPMDLPQVSPLPPISPLQLPGLTDLNQDGATWGETINETLRLSQFPAPPSFVNTQTLLPFHQFERTAEQARPKSHTCAFVSSGKSSSNDIAPIVSPVEIRIQHPTSITSPRPSASIRSKHPESKRPSKAEDDEGPDCEDIEDHDVEGPRRSVHLDRMRISRHLRSGSLLSWDKLAEAPDLSSPTISHHERAASGQSQLSESGHQLTQRKRRASSSGFTSTKMPSRWGKVLHSDLDGQCDVASSIYSSRPYSRPGSFFASLTNLSQAGVAHGEFSNTPSAFQTYQTSPLPPTSKIDDTPQTIPGHGYTHLRTEQTISPADSLFMTHAPLARKNSVADTKKSKFREELSLSPPRKRIIPSESIMKLLNPKRLSGQSLSETSLGFSHPIQSGDATYDTLEVPTNRERRQSQSMMSLQTEQQALNKERRPSRVWDQALKAHQEEKEALLLPKNRDLAAHGSPFRERSGSMMTRRSAYEDGNLATPIAHDTLGISGGLVAPSFDSFSAPRSSSPARSPHSRLVSRRSAMDANQESLDREVSVIFERQGDSPEIVGAWGRYPSHTRDERNSSASKPDRVDSRDFALEAAIQFASAQDVDEDMIDPTERVPSMPLMPGEKKKKKKLGSGRMAKSSSMTFGKTFLKNYSKLFKSSSAEFRKHGRGHRSSIATGGVLEYPELEILPEAWKQTPPVDGSIDRDHYRYISRRASDNYKSDDLEAHDSMATLRPRRNSSAPNLNILACDSTNEDKHAKDSARIWSVYYDDCIPSYPRTSMDPQVGSINSGFGRFSFESQAPSIRSCGRLAKHSRNASRISRISIFRRINPHQSFKSKAEVDDSFEKRSLVSVRRSTMDLLSMFKEQEDLEREKIFSITRAGSNYNGGVLSAL